MGKVTHNLDAVRSLEAVPKDTYTARVSKSEYKKAQSGMMKFELVHTILQGDYVGKTVPFDNVSCAESAAWKMDEVLDAYAIERQCMSCGHVFDQSMIVEKLGSVCPGCQQKTNVTWDSGTPDGVVFLNKEAQIAVDVEPSQKDATRMVNTVTKHIRIN